MNIVNYHTSGFLSKAKYSAYFSDCFEKLGQLASLGYVRVFLFEEAASGVIELQPTSILVSDNGNGCIINIPFGRYYQPNSDLWFTPTAKEIFETIDRVMTAADEMYKDEVISEANHI